MDEEIPYLLQEKSRRDLEIILILILDCLWQHEPWLRGVKLYPDHDPKSGEAKTLAGDYKKRERDSVFHQVAHQIYEALQPGCQKPKPAKRPGTPPEKEDIRLPETGELLFGRRDELKLLDKAWEDDSTNVVVLKAGGGVGKSTLTRVWTPCQREENYHDAERVFAWSFYSQGTRERVTSADAFIAEALDWFGDPDSTKGSPWDKGERLARLVAEKKTLLLLDGMRRSAGWRKLWITREVSGRDAKYDGLLIRARLRSRRGRSFLLCVASAILALLVVLRGDCEYCLRLCCPTVPGSN